MKPAGKRKYMQNKFKELGLSDQVVASIEKLGYENPSDIQNQIIPYILKGNDVIGQAQTGTGKTLAFAASVLTKIDVRGNLVKAICLVPTRELAIQVSEEFNSLNKDHGFDVLAVYGGTSIETQIRALKRGIDVVVGTPGRVMDLMRRGVLKIEHLEFFILDEADEMLNMGFLEDIESIFKMTNDEKQVLLFSATMPKEIEKLARKYMKPDYHKVMIASTTKTSDHVKQYYYVVNGRDRMEALCRVLDARDPKSAIIFCQKKSDVDGLLTELSKRNYSAEAMHGDIAQNTRIQTLDRFKQGGFQFLIATDVAARGIHVDDITCVINYNLPQDVESYIHRIGRTGRADKVGYAITFVTNREVKFLRDVEKQAKCEIIACPLPVGSEIMEAKTKRILENVYEVIEHKEQEPYIKYVRDMNKEDLIKFGAGLLKVLFDREIGSDLSKDLTVQERKNYGSRNATRVFLTIGKLDHVKKGSLLDFIKEETKLDKAKFNNIEVLTKFTFMDVENDTVDLFMKKIRGKKFNNRVIRVEKAKRR